MTFTCEVSQDQVKATWKKDGKELIPSAEVVVETAGKVHKLTLKNATLDDRAEYTISVKDKESTAPLFVEGQCSFSLPLPPIKFPLLMIVQTEMSHYSGSSLEF